MCQVKRIISIFKLVKVAREKGHIVTVTYDGSQMYLTHQEPITYKVLMSMTAHFCNGDAGILVMEGFLKELIS